MKRRTSTSFIENDVYAPFSEACGSKDGLREKLRLISVCQDRRFQSEKAIERLRFLSLPIAAQHPLPATTHDEAAKTCTRCAKYPLFNAACDIKDNNTSEQICTLRLTDPGDLQSCNHYVAVSYCWEQPKSLPKEETPAPSYTVLDGSEERECRAPPNIIRRAIDFAIFKGYRLLWIDQECIDQYDIQDKSLHIQAMHLIYRQASDVVAILNSVLSSQVQADMLEYQSFARTEEQYALRHCKSSQSRMETKRNVAMQIVQLAESLASDPWYTRAWTYQEALLATRSVFLLIPCRSGLRAPSLQMVVGSQLVVNDTEVLLVLNSLQAQLNDVIFHNPAPSQLHDYKKEIENREIVETPHKKLFLALEVLRDSIPGWKSSSVHVALEVHRLSARDAIQPLLRRGITDCLDLIAICGNLCNYSIRLDTHMVREAHIGLSVALFALALLNGDVSLLLALNRNALYSVTDCSKSLPFMSINDVVTAPNKYVLIDWVAESIYGCRIRSPALLSDSLLTRGILWRVEDIDVSVIRLNFTEHEDSLVRQDCPASIVQKIIDATCHYLNEKDEPALVRAIQTSRYEYQKRRLVLTIVRYGCLPIARTEDPALSGYRLLPGTAYEYRGSETDDYPPIFGANRAAYIFTPYRVLIEAESHNGIPQFLLVWWISRIATTPVTAYQEDGRQKETGIMPTMTDIFSLGRPSKMKVDEMLFFGDVKRLVTSISPSEEVYRLHCF